MLKGWCVTTPRDCLISRYCQYHAFISNTESVSCTEKYSGSNVFPEQSADWTRFRMKRCTLQHYYFLSYIFSRGIVLQTTMSYTCHTELKTSICREILMHASFDSLWRTKRLHHCHDQTWLPTAVLFSCQGVLRQLLIVSSFSRCLPHSEMRKMGRKPMRIASLS